MHQGRPAARLRTIAVYSICTALIATAVSVLPFVRAADQPIDLDGNAANGAESKVSTKVLQTYPVKVENTVNNNAAGAAYTFRWFGAGPGGFNSFVTAGPGVGTKWVWSTVYQVYSIDSPVAFTPSRTLSVFGTPPKGVEPSGAGTGGSFAAPGKSIYPTDVTLSDTSLSSSLITFFSPERTVASCGVQCVPGECELFLENRTGGTATISVQQLDCCPEAHQLICDGECKSYLTDTENCGGCGNVCASDEICSDGACVCPPGLDQCGAGCIDLQTSPDDCGACGNVCASDELCSDGACICNPGLTQCGEGCVDLQTSPDDCGACGNACASDELCSSGACVCNPGLTQCGEGCVDLQADTANCGACGTACAADELCSNGACVCNPGLTQCGEACIDLQSDAANCGACGTACAADELCSSGACVCNPGLTQCGAGCIDLQTDPANCGACGTVCAPDGSCSNGACLCPAGLTQCGATCVALQTDPLNCGACGRVCGANAVCTGGICVACRPPKGTACNNQCVNTHTDPNNCGACGNVCDFSGCPSSGQGTCSQGSSCVCAPAPVTSTTTIEQSFKPVHRREPARAEIRVSRKTSLSKLSASRRRSASAGQATVATDAVGATSPNRSRVVKAPDKTDSARQAAARKQAAGARSPNQTTAMMRAAGTSTANRIAGVTKAASAPSVNEAPVCDIPAFSQVIPNGGMYSQTQTGGRFHKEIQTTVSIAVNGKTIAEGPCPQVVPVAGMDTSGVILSASSVATQDASGDGLCQPGEAWCKYLITVADLGDSACMNPVATLSSPPDEFNTNEVAFLNAISSYPSLPAYPGDGVPLEKRTNATAFSITPPPDQLPDVGRSFLMSVACANQPAPVLMPITLGIGSACNPGTIDGKAYDRLVGFQGPVNAVLVAAGNPVNYSTRTFNHGSTIPLKLTLACGNLTLTDAGIDPNPQIVAVVHETLGPQSLLGINGDNGANPDDPQFSCSDTACDYQFRTEQLPIGRYIIGVQMPDTRVFQAGLTISP